MNGYDLLLRKLCPVRVNYEMRNCELNCPRVDHVFQHALQGGCTWSGGVSAPLGGCTWSGWCLLRGCTWSGTPPVDRQTPVNLLPCPKLRLRAVIKAITTRTRNIMAHQRQLNSKVHLENHLLFKI